MQSLEGVVSSQQATLEEQHSVISQLRKEMNSLTEFVGPPMDVCEEDR